jgi:hypothetical protein
MTITRTNFPQYQVMTDSSGVLFAWTQKTVHCAASEMGPPLRPEIPKIFLERFRKTRAFTPAAARLNAVVTHTVFGHGDCDACTSAWATTSRRCVFSACRVPSRT